jgi:hypothetical protein
VFSLVPRCQGLCGSQKYTFTSVATVKVLCYVGPVHFAYGDIGVRAGTDASGYSR